MFPSREEVFKPIPITIGEPRVVGEDTMYVLEAAEYELVAPMRELLPDARKALDHTAREYRRVFGDEPQRIVVELRAVSRDRVADGWIPDSVEPPDGPRRAVAPAIVERRSSRAPVAPAQFLMMRAARAWILARTDFRVGRLPNAPLPAPRFGDDARIPDWIEDALIDLIGGSPWQEMYVARLAEREEDVSRTLSVARSFLRHRPRVPPEACSWVARRVAIAASSRAPSCSAHSRWPLRSSSPSTRDASISAR
jgi:hypothetical protein